MEQALVDIVGSRIEWVWIALIIFALSFVVFSLFFLSYFIRYEKEIRNLREDLNEIRDLVEDEFENLDSLQRDSAVKIAEQGESTKNVIFRLAILEERLDMRHLTLDYKVKRGPGRPPKNQDE